MNSSELERDQQDSPLFLRLPTEIRLCIYELALEDALTQIESFIRFPTLSPSTTLKCRGPLALLLVSKAIRAEFSEGVMPLVTAHCKDFSARVEMLKPDWEKKITALGQPQPGQRIIEFYCETLQLQMQRDIELGDAQVAMQALSTAKHIIERTVEDGKPELKSSNNIEDESFKADA